MHRIAFSLALILLPLLVSAQDGNTGWIKIQTATPDAFLLVDGAVQGQAADAIITAEGEVVLELVETNTEAWQPRRSTLAVTAHPGDTLTVTLDLPLRYRIESFPVGAEIIHVLEGAQTVMGEAPLEFEHAGPLEGHFVASLPGFMEAELDPGREPVNRHTVMMRPLEDRAHPEAASGWSSPRGGTAWMDYAAAGVALASAGIAVYYKFEADSVDDLYREPESLQRGDPALKAEAERLDTYSLAALAAMQASIGFIAVRFVLR